jgi:aspartyl-tRNA(Asn)/glutamyl-tRNA(Gln) amidotransferase subunit C
MSLSVDEVRRIARLAHLELDPAEAERLGAQLARVLDYVAMIDAVDTSAVDATTHAVGLSCPLRDDRLEASLEVDAALRGAPQPEAGRFGVPKFVG